jgi:hypothetical protein
MGSKKNKNKKQQKTRIKPDAPTPVAGTANQENTSGAIEIYIEQDVYNKIMHWVNKSNNEVSGFGNVVFDAVNKRFTVVDAFLIEQYNSGATTEIEAAALGKMYAKHFKFGSGALKWWWHSHVNMNVFWSGTDESTIRQYGANGYICASVFNKRNEIRSAVCYKSSHKMFGDQVAYIDNVTTKILYPAAWDEEYDANVKTRTYTTPSYQGATTYNTTHGMSNQYGGRGGGGHSRTIEDFRKTHNVVDTSTVKAQDAVETERAGLPSSKIETIDKTWFTGDLDQWGTGKTYLKGVGYVYKKELDELTNPNTMPKKPKADEVSTPQMFNDNGKKPPVNTFVNGLLGDYGLAAEAKALSMSVDAYERILAIGSEQQLDNLQDRLTTLEQSGYFEKPDEQLELTNESGTIEDGGYGEGGI